MGGVEENIGDLRQGDRLRGRGEAPSAVVAENDTLETAEFYVRRYFRGSKGVALGTRKAWPRLGRQGSSGVWCREQWSLI